MGKNFGGKHQKSMKNSNVISSVKLDDITPNEEHDHTFVAIVTRALGSKRFEVNILSSNTLVNAVLPGSFRRRVNVDDFVFVQYEEGLSGSNCFILHIYSIDEMKELKIKKPVKNINDTVADATVIDEDFVFEDI
jgi:translation initiation factor IF-1